MVTITEEARLLCEEHGATLLYLTKFGSHLYGTDTPDSDSDYRGIFLPSFESIVTQQGINHISRSSGSGGSTNTNDDVDLDLWSLQYWLKLVGQGDTGAVDLLYSWTHQACVEYTTPEIKSLLTSPLKLFDPSNTRAFVGYAIGQARKYGIKGSRLGVLKKVHEWVEALYKKKGTDLDYVRLGTVLPTLMEAHHDGSYCFVKVPSLEDAAGVRTLVLCGKMHQDNITMSEFRRRVKDQYETYGERARMAEKNQGIDWKALSHAVRCINQLGQLLGEGEITFPLKCADMLKRIKAGEHSWDWVEGHILGGLEAVDHLVKTTDVTGKTDHKFVSNYLVGLYR